jgi:hypothetical protein
MSTPRTAKNPEALNALRANYLVAYARSMMVDYRDDAANEAEAECAHSFWLELATQGVVSESDALMQMDPTTNPEDLISGKSQDRTIEIELESGESFTI